MSARERPWDYQPVVGARMKAIREMRHLTREQVARAVGTRPRHVEELESGLVPIDEGREMDRLCRVLQVSPCVLCDVDGTGGLY